MARTALLYPDLVATRRRKQERARAAAQRRDRARTRRDAAMEFLAGHRHPGLVARYKASGLAAYHEAGHVVAAWVTGHDVLRATIDAAGDCGETGVATRTDPWDTLTVLRAGIAAETKHPDWDPELAELWNDCDDWTRFELLADEFEPTAGLVAAGRAIRIVDEHSRDIARVAEALGRSGELGYDELEALRRA